MFVPTEVAGRKMPCIDAFVALSRAAEGDTGAVGRTKGSAPLRLCAAVLQTLHSPSVEVQLSCLPSIAILCLSLPLDPSASD